MNIKRAGLSRNPGPPSPLFNSALEAEYVRGEERLPSAAGAAAARPAGRTAAATAAAAGTTAAGAARRAAATASGGPAAASSPAAARRARLYHLKTRGLRRAALSRQHARALVLCLVLSPSN